MPQTQKNTPARRPGGGKATRASTVADALRRAILRGDLAPGQKVNLDQLREAHQVSLSPLREAVSRLVAGGLVEFEDQRGYRIAPVSAANLEEVTRLRAELEGMALDQAILRAGLDWESDVLSALHRLSRSPRDTSDPTSLDTWDEAHLQFHRALIGGCDMPLLLGFCDTLLAQNQRYHRLHPDAPCPPEDHGAIAEAAIRRDGAAAVSLLRTHIDTAGAALARHLQTRMTDPAR